MGIVGRHGVSAPPEASSKPNREGIEISTQRLRLVFMGTPDYAVPALDALITALMAIYVVIGALPIIGAVTALRRRADIARPFSMWGYPLPSLVAAAGWIFILVTSGVVYIAAGVVLLAVGVAAYLWRARRSGDWPFSGTHSHQGGTRST